MNNQNGIIMHTNGGGRRVVRVKRDSCMNGQTIKKNIGMHVCDCSVTF